MLSSVFAIDICFEVLLDYSCGGAGDVGRGLRVCSASDADLLEALDRDPDSRMGGVLLLPERQAFLFSHKYIFARYGGSIESHCSETPFLPIMATVNPVSLDWKVGMSGDNAFFATTDTRAFGTPLPTTGAPVYEKLVRYTETSMCQFQQARQTLDGVKMAHKEVRTQLDTMQGLRPPPYSEEVNGQPGQPHPTRELSGPSLPRTRPSPQTVNKLQAERTALLRQLYAANLSLANIKACLAHSNSRLAIAHGDLAVATKQVRAPYSTFITCKTNC